MSDEKSNRIFADTRIASILQKLAQGGLSADESGSLMWELRLLKANPSGADQPVHEVGGILQPDFEEVRRRQAKIERSQ